MKPCDNGPVEERLPCLHCVTKGHSCAHDRQCKRVHESNLWDMPAVKQQELITFVGEHPYCCFENGCGPAGAPATA